AWPVGWASSAALAGSRAGTWAAGAGGAGCAAGACGAAGASGAGAGFTPLAPSSTYWWAAGLLGMGAGAAPWGRSYLIVNWLVLVPKLFGTWPDRVTEMRAPTSGGPAGAPASAMARASSSRACPCTYHWAFPSGYVASGWTFMATFMTSFGRPSLLNIGTFVPGWVCWEMSPVVTCRATTPTHVVPTGLSLNDQAGPHPADGWLKKSSIEAFTGAGAGCWGAKPCGICGAKPCGICGATG